MNTKGIPLTPYRRWHARETLRRTKEREAILAIESGISSILWTLGINYDREAGGLLDWPERK